MAHVGALHNKVAHDPSVDHYIADWPPWGIPTTIMHKQSIACDPEDVLSLDFEVVDGLRYLLACCVLWLDAKHGGGTGKRR